MHTATTKLSTLSLHDALPICRPQLRFRIGLSLDIVHAAVPQHQIACAIPAEPERDATEVIAAAARDRKSTRLNSSHVEISYAVFCLKKKKYKTEEHYYDIYDG